MLILRVEKYTESKHNSIKKWEVKNLNTNKLKTEVCNCPKVDQACSILFRLLIIIRWVEYIFKTFIAYKNGKWQNVNTVLNRAASL